MNAYPIALPGGIAGRYPRLCQFHHHRILPGNQAMSFEAQLLNAAVQCHCHKRIGTGPYRDYPADCTSANSSLADKGRASD